MVRKYPWEKWFAQDRTVLVRGADYDCSQSAMAGMVRNNASRRRVRVRIIDTGEVLVIDVVGRGTSNEAVHTTETAVPS